MIRAIEPSIGGSGATRTRRLLIVQFGDYGEAEHRFRQGGDETYYAQRYTVSYVAELARQNCQIRVVALDKDAPLERLPSGIESMGLRLYWGRWHRPRFRELLRIADDWAPSHLILHAPIEPMLRWAIRRGIRTLPLLADSFAAGGVRNRLWYYRLARALNHPSIPWVANHGPNAAADLVRIGVHGDKVVAFDWPAFNPPTERQAKKAPPDPRRIRWVFVGMLCPEKGLTDVIEAIRQATQQNEDHRAVVVGAGDTDPFRRQAMLAGVADRIEFVGKVPHLRVLEIMHDGDVVVVPSRHEYSEGMPMTIYEGLSSRTPIVVSDHPMFRGRIVHRKNGLVFEAGNPASLLNAVRELVRDQALYERLSAGAEAACANFFGPLQWDQVITRWLGATPEDDAWLRQFSMASTPRATESANEHVLVNV